MAGGRHGDGGGRVLQDLPRVVADEGPLELVAPRGADHEQISVSADGLMKAAGHRAGLDGQQLCFGARTISHRRKPLQRAPAVVELPLGVGLRAGRPHDHLDIHQQQVAVQGDQLLGQLEGVLAGLVVVDSYDDVFEHPSCSFHAGLWASEHPPRRRDRSSSALRDS